MKPPVVALVCENYPPDEGGIAVSAQRIARSLAAEVDLHVVRFPFGDPTGPARHSVVRQAPGLTIHELSPFVNGWRLPPEPALRTRVLSEVTRQLSELLAALEADLVHGFGLQNAGLVAACASRLLGLPLVQSVRGNDVGRNAFDGVRRRPLALALEGARAIVPVNRWLAELLDLHFPDLTHRVRVIPNGVDPDALGPAPEPAESAGAPRTPTVGFLGKLREKKGPHVVATVARRFVAPHEGTLLLVGGMNLDLFREAGWCGGELSAGTATVLRPAGRCELAGIIRRCDFLIFPSLDDGMANGLLETMACGRPAICSPVFADVVQHGTEGLLVSALDPAGWVAACEDLWRNPERRQAMGRAAHDRIRRDFTAAAERRAWLDLYAEVLSERSGPHS